MEGSKGGLRIPFSVTMAVTREAGVTSKAKLRMQTSFGAHLTAPKPADMPFRDGGLARLRLQDGALAKDD